MENKYSKLRKDRSGAQILDILYCLSYCHKNNLNYVGPWTNIKKIRNTKMIPNTIKLCNLLNIPKPIINGDKRIINHILSDKIYSPNNNYDEIFNDEFRNYIINKCKNNLTKIKKNKDDIIVSIHIRRGDVRNDNRWSFRYTPNSYYLKVIDIILKKYKNTKIYIFSESNSQENFNDFIKLGCILKLDGDLEEAWNYFIQSDILVLASSAFSIVPAIYNRNKVIYIWNKYFQPLKDWIIDIKNI